MKQRFFGLLEDMFIGAKVEGDSGVANLLSLKSQYFQKFKKDLEDRMDEIGEVAYDRLYTFFKSYFNESGSIFFANTPQWQKRYARVSNKDVELFYKTKDLYYIKSQKVYTNLDVEVDGVKFHFDASMLGERKGNEKKDIEFLFIDYKDGVFYFLVRYKTNQKAEVLKEITNKKEPAKAKDEILKNIESYRDRVHFEPNFVLSNITKLNHTNIEFVIKKIDESDSLFKKVDVLLAVKDVMKKDVKKIVKMDEETLQKAFNVYKKQAQIDYFIHKDARSFLKEQFDLWVYNFLADDIDSLFDEKSLKEIQKVKSIAYDLIDKIADFEDELKAIWLKPRFAKDANYVITKDRLEKYDVLDRFLKHQGMKEQIEEWKELKLIEEDFELEKIDDEKYKHLPFDTKYFKDIEIDLLEKIDNLDDELDGRLIHSENFQALHTLLPKYKRKVDLVYIDPPFNTGSDFDYIDRFQDSTWLTLMDNRIRVAHELLSKRGSFYLHLDDNANAYGKLLLKNIYKNVTEIIFDTNATKDEETDLFGYKSFGGDFVLKHQTIFFAKNENYKFNKLWKPNRNNSNLELGQLDLIAKKNTDLPKKMKDFCFFIEVYEDNKLTMKKIIVDEKIFPVGDIWNDIYSFTQSEMRVSESLSFSSSQKPEHLLRRIIQASSEQKDIILDFFAGIGTTAAVAKKLNRKFISIEIGEHFNNTYVSEDKFSYSTFEKLNKSAIINIVSSNKNEVKCNIKKLGILGRLKWVLYGDKNLTLPDGRRRRPSLTKSINWQGGGFFKYYSLEQFEDILQKARYKDNLETSPKMCYATSVDFENEKLFYAFEKLYEDVDIAETISNLIGEKIVKITKDVIFLENTKVDLNELTFENYPELKPLVYWS